jgi:hypothetical protein
MCKDNTTVGGITLYYNYLPKASKYLYIGLNLSIFLPRASNSLYISVTIDFQIANKLQLCMCKDNTTVGGITLYVEA